MSPKCCSLCFLIVLTISRTSAIFNGTATPITTYPFIGSIMSVDPAVKREVFECAITIISQTWVIGTDFCDVNVDKEHTQIQVVAGVVFHCDMLPATDCTKKLTAQASSQRRDVKRHVSFNHPPHKKPGGQSPTTFQYLGILLVQVDKEFDFSGQFVKPAKLPQTRNATYGCEMVTVCGWGSDTLADAKFLNDHLLCTETRVVLDTKNNSDCDAKKEQMKILCMSNRVIDSHVDADESVDDNRTDSVRGPCFQDQSGPVICRSQGDVLVVGVITRGTTCRSDKIRFSYFKIIEEYYTFIQNVTGIEMPFKSTPEIVTTEPPEKTTTKKPKQIGKGAATTYTVDLLSKIGYVTIFWLPWLFFQ